MALRPAPAASIKSPSASRTAAREACAKGAAGWHIAQRVSSLFAGIGKIAAAKGLNGGFQHNAHVFKCWRANGALFTGLAKGAPYMGLIIAGAGICHGQMVPCQPYFLVNKKLQL